MSFIVLSHKSYPHLPAHCPDLQRPQRPWEEAAEKALVHPLAGAEWLTQLQTQSRDTDGKKGESLDEGCGQKGAFLVGPRRELTRGASEIVGCKQIWSKAVFLL